MACKQSIPAIVGCKPPSRGGHVRARPLAAALTLGAGVALSAVTAAVCSATAQELEWATRAGGGGFAIGIAITTDSRGNSYITGQFSGTATFGKAEHNETALQSGSPDMFVAKYARDGSLLWATSTDAVTDGAFGAGIATDPHGNSYVTGQITSQTTFGAGEANETVLDPAGSSNFYNAFAAKYARDGTFLWAILVGAGVDEKNQPNVAIAADPLGSSYVTGNFDRTATFGAGEANETMFEDDSGHVFVAKYARDGTLVWATQSGGDLGRAIAIDPRGNSYVTGDFRGTVTFGAGEANETVLKGGGREVFVAKYATDGTLLWATSARSPRGGSGTDTASDPSGNSYVTGFFSGAATFGAGEANETVLEGAGSDLFVAKYARGGTLLWAMSAGKPGFAEGNSIAIDPRGNSYVTGFFSGAATFGAGEANETVLEGAGSDLFVAKYAPDGSLVWATGAGGASFDSGFDIATDPRGNSYVTGSFGETATFGAGEANETVLEAAGGSDVFVAKYGVRNDQDQCPDSDRSATVVLDGNDTGVENVPTNTGCTILDLILQASEDAANRADFIRSVALLTRTLLRDGLITAEEAGILRTAASQASFPLS